MDADKISPNNWKEIVRGKKVIFYNTSIGSLLSGREKHIEKIEWVFGVFQKHPEVVLWWRPHPLELSTIQSMLPHLEEWYKSLRKQYQEERVGILDESTDLHRTIAISDAYYGDWSSVMELYKATGKPILLSVDNLKEYSPEVAFVICDFVIVDDYMWFISSLYVGLFKMNLNSFIVEEVVPIPGERIYEVGVMRYILQAGSELLLIPDWGTSVIAYDMDNKTMRRVVLGKRTTASKCSGAYYRNGNLFLISPNGKSQLKIDIKNLNVKSEHIETAKIPDFQTDERFIAVKTVNEITYAIPRIENTVQITDLRTGQSLIKKIKIKEELTKFFAGKGLFDIYQTIERMTINPIYANEDKWVYTLPRYIDAVVNEKNEKNNVNTDINLCGKKIYDSVYQ